MKAAFNFPIFDYLSDARVLVELAIDAERAGWDAVFLWDHVNLTFPGLASGGSHVDPWIALGLIAEHTESVLLGTCVTPIARRRPTKLARECLTLHDLSEGRFVFGAGAGIAPSEFDELGDEADLKVRAEMLDEGLQLLRALWSGADVDHQGKHYQVRSSTFAPGGADLPIWLAATWPNLRPFRRAARYDGVLALKAGLAEPLTPADVADIAEYIGKHRDDDAPFNLAIGANTTGDPNRDRAHARALAAAGANWWLDGGNTQTESLEQLRKRVRQGPPNG